MASEQIVDIESLVQPISEEHPAGNDLRQNNSPTSDYFNIKQARNSARAAERSGLFDSEAAAEAQEKWRPVLDIAPKILKDQSKDLEVVCWYIEALLRFGGFAGLRDGFHLARELVSRYWDSLYPEPDEDGMETKVAPLTGLNGEGGEGTLLAPIRTADITDVGSQGPFSFWQYQKAADLEKIADMEQREQRAAAQGYNLKAIRNIVAETPAQFYVDLRDDLEACLEHYRELNKMLDEHCGSDAPPASNIRNLLEDVLAAVNFIAKEKLAAADSSAAAQQASAEASTATEVTSGGTGATTVAVGASTGAIRSRDDALNRLREIAEYFRKTEPHSPLANSIERAVRWGRMPLQDLLIELLPEHSARTIYSQLTGVHFAEGDESGSASQEEVQDHKSGW